MRLIFYTSIYLSVIYLHFACGNEVTFLKYCLNGSNPERLPKTGAHSSGSLVMNKTPETGSWYLPDLNCSVTLSSEKNHYILLTFSNVSLRNSSMDNLTIFYNDASTDNVLAGQQVCSNENCKGLKFDSGKFSNITLKFISANVTVPQNVTGFLAHFTVYDLADPNTGACQDKHRFLCENKHCIFYDFVCDGHNNCGDLSDETKCEISVKNTVWGIVVIVIAIFAAMIFVPMFIFLAFYGTRSTVKSVMLPNQPTPLSNAADCGETSSLLTSSEAVNNCWPGTSYDSFSYGSAHQGEPSSRDQKKHLHPASEVRESQVNKFL